MLILVLDTIAFNKVMLNNFTYNVPKISELLRKEYERYLGDKEKIKYSDLLEFSRKRIKYYITHVLGEGIDGRISTRSCLE
ncbi:hypothetical protein [Staphylothermus marinus]|uniref:hypothetical protein n=1 Tax=Staphylothermus marinus TaxID=2280 RepID=UPI00069A4811|nr:hypothetical protein [Staphylothermus marinus]